MGFTPTFYAGRPKLSEVTIDSDLDMGGRNISGVDTLQAGRVDSPYMPKTWPTEELDWGDREPEELYRGQHTWPASGQAVELTITTIASSSTKITVTLRAVGEGRIMDIEIKVNGGVVATHGPMYDDTPYTFSPFLVHDGDVISIVATNFKSSPAVIEVTFTSDGITYEDKTFDLSGKWLALGLDMKGLAATVKIQGVEMPYSDYAKYFPLAPTELTIPGEWNTLEERPIIEVYK